MVAKQLEEVFQRAAQLSEEEQVDLAKSWLEEVIEREWQKRFAQTGDQLDKLADEALREHRAGLSEPLDPDTL